MREKEITQTHFDESYLVIVRNIYFNGADEDVPCG